MAIIVRMVEIPKEFHEALPILQKIESAGYEAYFVGGSVRDTILKRPIHDVDIATSAYPSEVKALFKRTVDTGIEHGTVMILDHGTGYEVTTFRTESGYQDYRRPDHVTFVRSLKEDLKRRDFTINALALAENGQVTDLFGGLSDMRKHIIRAVGDPNERFNEDALRMMRAVRFASQLDFKIEDATLAGIALHSQLLAKIAVERSHTEFVKMMLGSDANHGLKIMIQTNLYQHVPILGEHLDQLRQIADTDFTLTNEVQVWALLAFKFGFNSQQITRFLKRWKTANKIINDVILTVELLFAIQRGQVTNLTLYHAGSENVDNAIAVFADQSKTTGLSERYNRLAIKNKHQLKITGGELIKRGVLKPSPQLGQVLNYLEQNVVADKINNEPEDLVQAAINFLNED
ncbi:CCA tRNA nucleotidyltransferase [Lentilactobacillus buchneri]|nr:CCA tRNA nucleotidyltransferase [Lentilactobacillus buchneri]MCC6100316.1 CCA tRNA nucleotidyltransferase [Lactobacillus sp.]MCT2900398.1 CCA tRNA nucleotidyltransferase [Lentilactobacillus buchneri]MCT3543087.1 CCA tRNA nucleotidyltransferase [Lentilactobacillus buchneri]MCT3544965.1 CCA tRNA nucleotidyltransferase [Lentilactobacillus buchneri]MCT3551977.1 CCA tRNA nucleotidyltransferase [Lentilactobacillus buchneri]